MSGNEHRITDEAGLEAVIGAPMEYVRAKVLPRLNEAMMLFIAQTPLIFISTVDANGEPDISPKGDPEGFVVVDDDGNLLIPERPGNRLTFGFRNILRSGEQGGEIGLIFVVPNQLETLRIKGRATLHTDPAVLARMQVGGKPALLYTRVVVEECMFHCGKALVRSKLWQPAAWQEDKRSIAARGLATPRLQEEAAVRETEAALDLAYKHTLY